MKDKAQARTLVQLQAEFALPFSNETRLPHDGLVRKDVQTLSSLHNLSVHVMYLTLNHVFNANGNISLHAGSVDQNRVQVSLSLPLENDGTLKANSPTAIRNFTAAIRQKMTKEYSGIYFAPKQQVADGFEELISYDLSEMTSILYGIAEKSNNPELKEKASILFASVTKWYNRDKPQYRM